MLVDEDRAAVQAAGSPILSAKIVEGELLLLSHVPATEISKNRNGSELCASSKPIIATAGHDRSYRGFL
jgi:hypothetical protein